jgi:hypothetical protein
MSGGGEKRDEAAAVDEAAARTFDATVAARLAPLREISAALVERATELDRELARLAEQANAVAETLRGGPGGSPSQEPVEPVDTRERPRDPYAGATLDDVERTRASLSDSDPSLRRFHRRVPGPEIPEGVRLAVAQMRLAGEPDSEIARRLAEMGVDEPGALLTRIES